MRSNGNADLFKEMLIYSNQHQNLRLNMLIFQGFLALPLTGESFNQRFLKSASKPSALHDEIQ
jgi:hypothetical protein